MLMSLNEKCGPDVGLQDHMLYRICASVFSGLLPANTSTPTRYSVKQSSWFCFEPSSRRQAHVGLLA